MEKITRREFVSNLGKAGGAALAAHAGRSFGGMLPRAAPPGDARARIGRIRALPAPAGARHVVIVGGGIAGLVSAYELSRKGVACTILEARPRLGGRVLTVRRGTSEALAAGGAARCDFDEGLHFDAGASRIPEEHEGVLDYCDELRVPLARFIHHDPMAYRYYPPENGKAGYRVRIQDDPRPYAYRPEFAPEKRFYRAEGGNDRIVEAFARRLKAQGARIRLSSPIDGFAQEGGKVAVRLEDGSTVVGDRAICTLPFPLLDGLAARAPERYAIGEAQRAAMKAFDYLGATKIGVQCAERFWQRDGILGGTSVTAYRARNPEYAFTEESESWRAGVDLREAWYPGDRADPADKGILMAGYPIGWDSLFNPLTAASKRAVVADFVGKFHPEFGKYAEEHFFAEWANFKHSGTGFCFRAGAADRDNGRKLIAAIHDAPRGLERILYAGEHLSAERNAWMEGAVESALSAVERALAD